MTPESVQKFQDEGFLVIKDFLSAPDIASLQHECSQLVDSMDPSQHRSFFSTINNVNLRDDYFITSSDKVRFFFEEQAFDSKGNLSIDKHLALNKIGHALHVHCPAFKRVAHSERVKSYGSQNCLSGLITSRMRPVTSPWIDRVSHCCLQGVVSSLGMLDAVIVQSMYIFKPPSLEGKGGLNGDLRRVRCPQTDGSVKLVYEGAVQLYDQSLFEPCPVSKGSLVLIDGWMMHQSQVNCDSAQRSRHIYGFHVYDSARYTWEPSCWLQETRDSPFAHLSQA